MESQQGFILDPALDPSNYQISNSLRDVEKWKAKCYVGNNGDEHLGEMMEVGYIMISKTDNRIIPIARDDEHNMGRDLLYDLQDGHYGLKGKARKVNIDPDNYVPVWPMGNNYIYEERDIPVFLNVVKKYLSYGGRDGMLKGSNSLSGVQLMLSDFVAQEGNVKIAPDSLAPVGKRIVEAFTNLSRTIVGLGQNPDRIQSRKAFVEAATVVKFILGMGWELGIDSAFSKELPIRMRELQKANDFQGLQEAIFGFHGLKNIMHMKLKKLAAEAATGERMAVYYLRDAKAIWGDVDLAIDMLGRI